MQRREVREWFNDLSKDEQNRVLKELEQIRDGEFENKVNIKITKELVTNFFKYIFNGNKLAGMENPKRFQCYQEHDIWYAFLLSSGYEPHEGRRYICESLSLTITPDGTCKADYNNGAGSVDYSDYWEDFLLKKQQEAEDN